MTEPVVLIAGGYGEVGRRLAALLEPRHPGRVVLGGRHPERASGLRAVRLDLDDAASVAAALAGCDVVVSCVRQPSAELLRAVIDRGLAFTSIAPPWLDWRDVRALDADAHRTGARIVLATGLEPGISSLLARIGTDRLGGADAIETALCLSVGDAYGPDSMSFLFEEVREEYSIVVDGREVPARAFERPRRVAFPHPVGTRRAYTMPFRDQHYYPHTLGAKSSVARLALEPPWLADLTALLLRLGLRSRVGRGRARETVRGWVERLRAARAGDDRWALVVEVRRGSRAVISTLVGREQAQATAVGAFAVAEALANRELREPGVQLVEQVVLPARFLERLRENGLVPEIEEREVAPSSSQLALEAPNAFLKSSRFR